MHYNAYRILHAISLPVKMSPVLCLNFGSASTVHAVRCLNSYCAQTLTTCRYSKKEVPLSKIGSFGTTGDSVAPLLKRVERCFCSFYKPKPNLQISDYHLPISIKEILEGKNIFFGDNCYLGGNDYTISEAAYEKYHVADWTQTRDILAVIDKIREIELEPAQAVTPNG